MSSTLPQPPTTAAWAPCMRVGERRDGALLSQKYTPTVKKKCNSRFLGVN
jgi:hypothetical protein